MRVPRTLSIYLLREVLLYAALGTLVIGSILVTQNLLRQLDELSTVGFSATDSMAVLVCVVGMLAAYALPMAFLFGVLVAVGRMSADSEVTAMRALGISFGQVTAPLLVLALLASAATGVLLYEVEPLARRQLRAVFSEIASRGGIIEPGRFNQLDREEGRLLFVEKRDDNNRLSGILISDRSDPEQPFTVFAERGRFSFDAEKATARLELEAGDIHFDSSDAELDRYRRISFETADYEFDMSAILGADPSRLRPKEMSTQRIQEVIEYFDSHDQQPPDGVRIKTREPYEIQLHRRLALPVAPVLFALVGIPLGLRRSRGARSWGVLICVVLVFSYYALLSFGVFLAEDAVLTAPVAMWIPNFAFALSAVPLLYRARRAEI